MGYKSKAMYPDHFFTKRVQDFFRTGVQKIIASREVKKYAIDIHDDKSVLAGRQMDKIKLNSEEILFTVAYLYMKLKYPPLIRGENRKMAIADGIELLKALLELEPAISAVCYYYLNEFDHFQDVSQSPYKELMLCSPLVIPEQFVEGYRLLLLNNRGNYSKEDIFAIPHILQQIRESAKTDAATIAKYLSQLNTGDLQNFKSQLNRIINSDEPEERLACQFLRYAYFNVGLELVQPNEALTLLAAEVKKHLDLAGPASQHLILINIILKFYDIFNYLFQNPRGADKERRAKDFIEFIYRIKLGLIETAGKLNQHFEQTNLQHQFNRGGTTRYNTARNHLLSYLCQTTHAQEQMKFAADIFVSYLNQAQSIHSKGFASHLLTANISMINRLKEEAQQPVDEYSNKSLSFSSPQPSSPSLWSGLLGWIPKAKVNAEAPEKRELQQKFLQL